MKKALAASSLLAALLVTIVSTPGCLPPDPEQEVPSCVTGGCSGQLCVNEADYPGGLVSTCEWKPEYACIKKQKCGAINGSCGWSPTPESEACFAELKCSVFGYPKVTLDALVGNMAAYDGKNVMVCGNLLREPMMCTLMGCVYPNSCCNSCGGGFAFNDSVSVEGKTDGKSWGCGGNECVQTCHPFDESAISTPRCYFGVFEKYDFGDYGVLHVEGFNESCQ